MIALGIDVGGTSIKMACFEDGRIIWQSQSPFYARPDTVSLIDALKVTAAGRVKHVDVAGLCVPGLMDREKRMITLSVNVPGLMGITLDEIVAHAFGGEITRLEIVNDAVATATDVILAKKLKGRIVSLALGTGVGMGVLDDGKPLMVDGASPGHIGQVDCSIDDNPPLGPDGGAGSLEGYLGVLALQKAFGSTEVFISSATVEDAPIRALIRAIRICHAIYRPNHVVLVGGIGVRLSRLIPAMRDATARNLTSIAQKDWTLLTGDHDFHAAQGAARVAMNPVPSPPAGGEG